MSAELKKWSVWLSERYSCQVEAVAYTLKNDGRATFLSAHPNDEKFLENPEKFIIAEFLGVRGIIEYPNNEVFISEEESKP